MGSTIDRETLYDTEVKKALAAKDVLAWILKYTTSEFKDYDVRTIEIMLPQSH